MPVWLGQVGELESWLPAKPKAEIRTVHCIETRNTDLPGIHSVRRESAQEASLLTQALLDQHERAGEADASQAQHFGRHQQQP